MDTNTFRVRQTEGMLAKKPSWWVKQHHIVLQFAEVKGIWIHTSTEITAIVRIFGKYELTAQEVDLTLPERSMLVATPDWSRAVLSDSIMISGHRPHPGAGSTSIPASKRQRFPLSEVIPVLDNYKFQSPIRWYKRPIAYGNPAPHSRFCDEEFFDA